MDLPSVININPLNTLKILGPPNPPSWLCAHPQAVITDPTTKRYTCLKCNPRGGKVKKFSQLDIASALKMEPKP
jgi:hypothetical protein